MRAIGVEAFRNHRIFNDPFISKQITAVVSIGNELLNRKRFCPMQEVAQFRVENCEKNFA